MCDTALPSSRKQLLPAPLIGFLFAQQWCWIMIRRLWLQQLISEEKKSAEIGWPLQFPHRSAIYIFFFKGIYSETQKKKKIRVIIHHRPIVYFLFWLFIGAAQTIDGLILSRPGTTFIFSSKKLLWITHDSLPPRRYWKEDSRGGGGCRRWEDIVCVHNSSPFCMMIEPLCCVLIATKYQHNCPVFSIVIVSLTKFLFLFFFDTAQTL